MASIGDYFDFQNGYAFKSENFTENGKYKIVRIKELKDGSIKFFTDTAQINPDDSFDVDKYIIRKGDVLFALTGDPVNKPNPLSWVGRVSYYNHNEPALLNQRVCKAVPKANVSSEFLYYFFRQDSEFYNLASKATGSASQANISTKTIEQHNIDISDEITMDKIVSILSEIDKKIETNEAINRNLMEQAKLLYKSWFEDFEPFNYSMPSDWAVGTVDDLSSDVVCGKTPSTKKTEYYGEDVPFVTIPDMHGNVYTIETGRYLSILGAESQKKKTLPKNSISVSCIGTAGVVTLISRESQTNQQINSIVPKNEYSSFYIYLLMLTMKETIIKLGQGGSTIVNLNKTQFGRMEVLIPSVRVMREFDELVEPVFNKILSNQYENIKLANLRDSLLPKLMSGELNVSELDL